jgi:hypothetical protein
MERPHDASCGGRGGFTSLGTSGACYSPRAGSHYIISAMARAASAGDGIAAMSSAIRWAAIEKLASRRSRARQRRTASVVTSEGLSDRPAPLDAIAAALRNWSAPRGRQAAVRRPGHVPHRGPDRPDQEGHARRGGHRSGGSRADPPRPRGPTPHPGGLGRPSDREPSTSPWDGPTPRRGHIHRQQHPLRAPRRTAGLDALRMAGLDRRCHRTRAFRSPLSRRRRPAQPEPIWSRCPLARWSSG